MDEERCGDVGASTVGRVTWLDVTCDLWAGHVGRHMAFSPFLILRWE